MYAYQVVFTCQNHSEVLDVFLQKWTFGGKIVNRGVAEEGGPQNGDFL